MDFFQYSFLWHGCEAALPRDAVEGHGEPIAVEHREKTQHVGLWAHVAEGVVIRHVGVGHTVLVTQADDLGQPGCSTAEGH